MKDAQAVATKQAASTWQVLLIAAVVVGGFLWYQWNKAPAAEAVDPSKDPTLPTAVAAQMDPKTYTPEDSKNQQFQFTIPVKTGRDTYRVTTHRYGLLDKLHVWTEREVDCRQVKYRMIRLGESYADFSKQAQRPDPWQSATDVPASNHIAWYACRSWKRS